MGQTETLNSGSGVVTESPTNDGSYHPFGFHGVNRDVAARYADK